jgi:beta-glucanase (GH16 family)
MPATTTIMRTRRTTFIVCLLLILSLLILTPPQTSKAVSRVLVWSDEFNAGDFTAANSSKWRVTDRVSDVNAELQYYTPSDVFQWGGALVLKSERRSLGGRAYTSGRVDTKGKFQFQYGEVEMRAWVINASNTGGTAWGIWPGLWLVNAACEAAVPCAAGEWPPELDIGEWKGEIPSKIYMTQHYGVWPSNGYSGTTYTGPNFSTGFHDYKLVWDSTQVVWYVDSVERYRVTSNIPTKQMQIVLNVAVGGNFDGLASPASTTFPRETKIDYVRVYRWQ